MIFEVLIGLALIGFNSFEFIRINIFKIDKNALLVGLTSMLAIGFGIYLCIKNGLLLDYGTEADILTNWAGPMWLLGVICILIGLVWILSSILKYIIWKLKNK